MAHPFYILELYYYYYYYYYTKVIKCDSLLSAAPAVARRCNTQLFINKYTTMRRRFPDVQKKSDGFYIILVLFREDFAVAHRTARRERRMLEVDSTFGRLYSSD